MEPLRTPIPRLRRAASGRPMCGLGAAELAWALLQLFAIGGVLRESGWCLGELSAREVELGGAGLRRAPPPVGRRLRALQRRRERHLRAGHDLGCALFGVPLTAVDRLLRAWAEPRAADFAIALVREAVAEMRRAGVGPHRGWSRQGLAEVAHHVVHARLTPRRPAPASVPCVADLRPGQGSR